MRVKAVKGLLFLFVSVLTGAIALAENEVGISVPNWTVPARRATGSSGGLSTMTDISPGVSFVAMSPCRVFDTRSAVGPYGGPRLLANTTRNFDIDNGPCTGIPAGVEAYSMNFGAILPDGANGFVTIWPAGLAQPVVSSINPIFGGVVANAAIVPAGVGGAISVFPNTGLHLYGDINGYFTDSLNPFIRFEQVGSVDGGAVILGQNNSNANDSHAIGGFAGGTGRVHGIQGQVGSLAATGSSGVHGIAQSGICGPDIGGAGVLGDGGLSHWGVVGRSDWEAISGYNTQEGACGNVETKGSLGWSSTVAVRGEGNLSITGTKSFVDPHPTDASKVIEYISLEGAEAGTYFRGKGRFERGMARIAVPEDFRLVTSSDGLSVQVTPIGQMATVAVIRADLNEIVVQASRNVEFYYTVNGVRATFASHKPIRENVDFIPRGPEGGMIGAWSPEQKRRLIANRSFNTDGTANMETVERLNWEAVWQNGGKPVPATTPE